MEKNGKLYFAITNSKITEEFRSYLKSINRKIVCTYYGFCPYFYVGQNQDVTFYKEVSL